MWREMGLEKRSLIVERKKKRRDGWGTAGGRREAESESIVPECMSAAVVFCVYIDFLLVFFPLGSAPAICEANELRGS